MDQNVILKIPVSILPLSRLYLSENVILNKKWILKLIFPVFVLLFYYDKADFN